MPKHSRRRTHSRRRINGGDSHTDGNVLSPPVNGYVTSSVGGLTPFIGGLRKKRGGTALLDDIAIPALFISANQFLGSRRRKTANKQRRKRTRFSRKVR